MSILQLSRITHRKGLQENLPQLAGAEFGWSLDERRLFIGNGTIEDGAPVIGNTEILTEFSDVLALSSIYTYKGAQAGYIVTTGESGDDIVRSLQDKFDETVSVKDFGAKGDGVTNDGPAINRAYYELFCREINPEIRRALYFPAGTYVTNEKIKIPPFAKSYGDGLNSSTIKYVSTTPGVLWNTPGSETEKYVVETSDSLHQLGANIGNNGAITPTGVEMSSMGISSTEKNSLMLLNSLTASAFSFMTIAGPLFDITDLGTATLNTAAVKVISSNSIVSRDITFNKCLTSGTTYGLDVQDACKGVQFENGRLSLHFKGANIGTIPVNGGPTGVCFTRNIFDNIANSGIDIGPVQLNSSAFNVFYDVGNNFTASPVSPVINMESGGNVSIGDLFERSEADNITVPRIALNGHPSIAFDSSSAIKLGSYERQTGLIADLPLANPGNIFSINSIGEKISFKVDYTIQHDDAIRMGTLTAVNGTPNGIHFEDEYTESDDTGVTLTVEMPTASSPIMELNYISNSPIDATFKYSIVRLD